MRIAHQRQDFVVGHVEVQRHAYPVLGVAVEWGTHRLVALAQLGDALGARLDGDGREVVDVAVAKHVAGHVENEDGEPPSGKFLKRGAFAHSGQ